MEPERWWQVEKIYHAALEQQESGRAAFVKEACGGDEALRQEVESLLTQENETRDFIETPALELLAQSVAKDQEQPAGEAGPGLIGQTLGRYRIIEKLGAGGLGIVYRARDERLQRDVALKVLPPGALSDEQARKRFRKEALTLSQLNHPNLAVVYDFDSQQGMDFLAMEYVAGQTLAQKLASGPVPEKEVVALGCQIAEGLEEAHENAVVHRDLKPGNVMVTGKGRVKVLDFGLAKLLQPVRGEAVTVESLPQTQAGVLAGTVPYMAPEQLKGQAADPRTDVYALGAVLYELATGRRQFCETQTAQLIAAILTETPRPPRQINGSVSPAMEHIILRALEKDPARRYQSAKEVRDELQRLKGDSTSGRSVASGEIAVAGEIARVRRKQVVVRAGIAVGALLLTLAGLLLYRSRNVPAPGPSQWVQLTSFADSATSPALSPDGRILTFIRGSGTFKTPGDIYIKLLPKGEPVPLTHDGTLKQDPRFSPDGSRVVYSASDDTWMVPVLGGKPELMMRNASGLDWIDDRHLLFAESKKGMHTGVVTATESRAEERDVYIPASETGMAHRSYLSPDGKWVLIAEMDAGWLPCRLLSFDSTSVGKRVGPPTGACTSAAWSPDGRWMYFSSNAGEGSFHIWRQRFPDGQPEQVTSGPTEEEGIAFSSDGRSFITSVGISQSTLWLHDLTGERQISSEGSAQEPWFSPDGKALFFLVSKQLTIPLSGGELWKMDLESGRADRPLPGLAAFHYDVSADGRRIALVSENDRGQSRLWLASLDRSSPPRQVDLSASIRTARFDPSGGVFFVASDAGSSFLYHVNEDGSQRVKILPDPIIEVENVSPDGKWMLVKAPASVGDTPGRACLAYPTHGGRAVLIGGGDLYPNGWTSDGRFLYRSLYGLGWSHSTSFKVVLIPIERGQALPRLPSSGINSETDLATIRGVKVIELGSVMSGGLPVGYAPGPNPSIYAFTRTTVHRNLYRIAIP